MQISGNQPDPADAFGEDGSLKIMDDTDSDAAVTEAMKAALENEEVKNLIEQVQNDYQNALDADASLRVYVESIQ